MWLVQKVNADWRIVDNNNEPLINGGKNKNGEFVYMPTQYWIPRIQIMFMAEDPIIFAKRIAFAVKERFKCENSLRYNLYLDCMPNENTGELNNYVLRRVVSLAKNSIFFKNYKM